ncbi:T9SS type A sorting domain-containing protein [Neolewinella persica]|uniref:T9SS type A sorting domain-containing protein n=1 Tax=Neolewinella persica TaxID=70998 RepID=UPI00036B3C4E|nr:T9SS type A sorting domain-containing protein [Neolewinella persica]
MNLRLHKLVLLFCLVAISFGVSAQGVEEVFVLENESYTFNFLSRFQPAVGRSPEHGDVTIEEDSGAPSSYVLTYTPDANYLGDDDFLLVSFPFTVNVAFTEFDVTVAKAEMKARHDYATTGAGLPVTVDVTVNDSTNVGYMMVTSAPTVNAGSAEVIDNQIVFTPEPGFSGLTDLNYVVCSSAGVCDLGTVSVIVLPEAGSTVSDTIRVFTKRDEPQYIFAPEDAIPAGEPTSGSMVSVNGVMAYQPDADFVGDEFLSYTSPGASVPTVYHITVLDVETNDFAFEDRAYTAIGHRAKLNVLRNDLYDVFADCITFGAPQFGSIVQTTRKGEVIYTPPTGWSGVDKFTYSSMAPGCDGEPEVQTVYVFVSNFAPAVEETTLTTPAGTPIDLTYTTPGGVAAWSVVEQPTQGIVIADPITGKLSYTPNPAAAGQTDQLTLRYCLNIDENGNCAFSSEVTLSVNITAENPNACIDEDCVWPGDTNNDGVVDVGDLLPIGLAMGGTGTPRLSADPASWSAQYGEDWDDDINGLNLKHIDANGDQIISSLDTQVVMENLGLQHRLRSAPLDFAPFEISFRGPLVAEPGDMISLEILAGSYDAVIIDLAGFRMPFVYDNSVVDPNQIDIAFMEDSWISYDSPILSVKTNDVIKGRLDAAVTRTSSDAASGFGLIGRLDAVIIDLAGFKDSPLSTTDEDEGTTITTSFGGEAATTMNSAGHLDAVKVNPFELKIKQTPATEVGDFIPAEAADYLDGKLLAYPNPTADQLVVHLNGQQRFNSLQLTDLTGRTIRNEQGLDTNHRELSLGTLPNGIYTLTITTDDGVVNRKVEVLR